MFDTTDTLKKTNSHTEKCSHHIHECYHLIHAFYHHLYFKTCFFIHLPSLVLGQEIYFTSLISYLMFIYHYKMSTHI